jgi:ATP-dependent protease ClpP protease subunit
LDGGSPRQSSVNPGTLYPGLRTDRFSIRLRLPAIVPSPALPPPVGALQQGTIMATKDLRFTSDGAVQFLAAASARRTAIENDWQHVQRQLEAVWPRTGRTVVALIHEGDAGLTAEDATDLLSVLAMLGPDDPVDVILHTHGGSATAANRIAAALRQRTNTAAFVPFYAESAGTEVALACEEIHLGNNANLTPIDIHIEGSPARDLVDLARKSGPRASEALKLSAKVAERALKDEARTIDALIHPNHKQAGPKGGLARRLTGGRTYHSELIRLDGATALGLNVRVGVPAEIYRFIGTRRAQLRQLRDLDSQIKFVHRREPEPLMRGVQGSA